MQSFVYLSLDVFHSKNLIAKQRSHNSAILCECKSVIWKAQKTKRERFLSDSYLEIARNGPVFQECLSVCLSVLATDSKSKSENKQIVCSFEVYKIFEALKAHI
jgi:hypothetical protein